jgi:membrane protease YdiL (CAAX protease family)
VLVVILFIAILAIDNLYQYVITVLHLNLQTNDQVLLQRSKIAPISTYARILAAVFVAPFCEEIFFRGFVFPGLCEAMPAGWAIVSSSLLFALAHADLGSFAVLFIIGLALAFLRWRTKSLWPSIFLHFLNNGLGALLIILVMQGIVKQ